VNPPTPLPSSTVMVPAVVFATARSSLLSPLKSAATIFSREWAAGRHRELAGSVAQQHRHGADFNI
jgi:hypothetical protein